MTKIITIMAAFAVVACDAPTLPMDSPDLAAAHNPAQHGLSAAVIAVAAPAYTALDGASATNNGAATTLAVDAGGTIPRFADAYIGSVAVFGYAWADLATGKAFVAVIHPLIGRDSNQNPDAWHTHPVQLAGGTGASDFCIVSIGTSQGGIALHGDRLQVHVSARQAGVAASDLDVAAAFIVQGEVGCAGTGLGVAVLAAATP